MSYKIQTMEDVYKFSLTLYDYLKTSSTPELGGLFEGLVDDCFASQAASIAAHRKAYQAVLDQAEDLPADIRTALNQSLEMLK